MDGSNLTRFFTALPTWQFVLVATAGAMTLFTSLYLLRRGYVAPIASVLAVGLVLYLTFMRVKPSVVSKPQPIDDSSQFTVFRDMEPADQTRVNPWMGILQEDVYEKRTGPVGTFVGNDDYTKNAPLYPFQGTETIKAADISSCKLIERDLSKLEPSEMTALEARCQKDIDAVTNKRY